jgi:N-acetylglucosaminyl-diphospho-decaprenol L-rhamnosyltransferase
MGIQRAGLPARAAPPDPRTRPMRLLIVIVNYRSAALAIDCLRSLAPEVASVVGGVRVVVTDGASGDDSVERLSAAIRDNGWSAWATLTPLPRNGGFAYGNNEAIRPALASGDPPGFVLLLNPDTLVRPGALRAVLDFMHGHPQVGIVGGRLEHPDGAPQRSAFRFHSLAGELESALRLGPITRLLSRSVVAPPIPDGATETDWVSGACLMVRRAVLEQIGLLDEGYFMYFEETDLCLRARRAGWRCWYVPEARVVHLVGQSSGFTAGKARKPPPRWWFDSRRRYFVKNHGRCYALLADAAYAGGFALWRLRRLLQRKPDDDPPKFLSLFVRNSTLGQGFKI